MRKNKTSRNRLITALVLAVCLCMVILAGCTGTAQSADEPVLEEATVVRVVDGDTLVADVDGQDEKIRLIGVDTPESVNPDASKNTERGKEASENTKSILTKGKHVWLEADVQDEDKYNRKLRYVWLEKPTDPNSREEAESKMLNAVLVKDGWADPMEIAPNTKWASLFDELSVKQLIEKQGLTVHQLRMTLARLEKVGYGSLPIVLATDDEANDLRPILDTQDATVMTCSDRECHGLGAYVVIG